MEPASPRKKKIYTLIYIFLHILYNFNQMIDLYQVWGVDPNIIINNVIGESTNANTVFSQASQHKLAKAAGI